LTPNNKFFKAVS